MKNEHNLNRTKFLLKLYLETAFFDQTKTGDITNRLSADCQIMVDTLSLNINIFLRSSITAIGSIVFMVKLSWNLSLLTLIGLPFGFLLGRLYGSLFRDIQKRIQAGVHLISIRIISLETQNEWSINKLTV